MDNSNGERSSGLQRWTTATERGSQDYKDGRQQRREELRTTKMDDSNGEEVRTTKMDDSNGERRSGLQRWTTVTERGGQDYKDGRQSNGERSGLQRWTTEQRRDDVKTTKMDDSNGERTSAYKDGRHQRRDAVWARFPETFLKPS